ncbi:MAG: carboxypeptidase-like regulatory domain-containing protein [Chloroflexota bacterium]|nr:carboxypeptidase-like regulatory domain-containing protein [Chloroflexota bacterium]
MAGPTCPVERAAPATECADRPVAGAVIVLEDASGNEVARTTSGADGTYALSAPGGGRYRLVPEPVEGLLGTPPPMTVDLVLGERTVVDVAYDTGIR